MEQPVNLELYLQDCREQVRVKAAACAFGVKAPHIAKGTSQPDGREHFHN